MAAPDAGAAPFAYISNTTNNTVSVIDAGPQAVCLTPSEVPPCVVKTLTVGTSPGGIAVNPAGTLAYVVNSGDKNVSIIRTSDNTVLGTVLVGFGPWGVAVSSDNSKVYVGLSDSTVAVIDVNNGNSLASVPNVGGSLTGIVTAGSRAFVSDATNGQVVVIDGPTLSVVGRIDVGSPPNSSPMGLAANPSGTRVYATDIRFDPVHLIDVFEVSVINTALVGTSQNPVVQTLVIDPNLAINPSPTDNTLVTPGGVALSSDGSKLYVTNDALDTVTAITLSNGARADVAVGISPGGIATDPTGLVYAVNVVSRTVSVIDSTTNTVVKTIGVGQMPLVFGAFATAGPPPPPQFLLTLTTAGSGSIAPQPASATGLYDAGTVVTLTPVADPSSVFTGWSGACSGSSATCVVTMDAAKTVTATFTPQYSLFVTTLGTGTVAASPASTSWQYLAGTAVTLTATADPNFVFTGWSGACSGSSATCVVTMDAAKSVTATFTAQYSLFVTTLGNGTVSASPASATWKYLAGTAVTLTATPAANALFSGWSGACSGTATTCSVTMDAAKSVTATFALKQFALSVTPIGPGTVSAQPSSANNLYNVGTAVTLTATPAANALFNGWSGACSGTATTCSVTMDAAKSVTATFALKQVALSVTPVGPGTVSVQPSSANNLYIAGTPVTLTATPAASALFSGWSGACSGTAATCSLTMDAAKSVTATFTVKQEVLTLTTVGDGSIAANPGPNGGTYTFGTVVTLTALPSATTTTAAAAVTRTAVSAQGSQFAGWSGACAAAGTAPTCTVTMDAAKSVTATFTSTTPPPTTCDDTIKDLHKKVAGKKHPWWQNHQLKEALEMYADASDLLPRAKAKVGANDKRYVHAKKEFDEGKAALCHGHYWHAGHDFWETVVIAREILKQRR